MSQHSVDRERKFAFELAKSSPKKQLTSATKSNGISITMPYWDERVAEMAKQYPPDAAVLPMNGTWTLMATPMSVPRGQHGAQLVDGGNAVLLVGGMGGASGFSQLTSAELFPVADSGSSTPVVGAVPAGNVYISTPLADGAALAMSDGSIHRAPVRARRKDFHHEHDLQQRRAPSSDRATSWPLAQ